MIDINKIVAIDVHTHAEVSCRQPHDDYRPEFDEAFAKFFKSSHRPTIQVAGQAMKNCDVMIPFASIDRTKVEWAREKQSD